jgi:serine/threonine-protein kinase
LQLTDGFRYTYRPVASDASFAWLGHDAEVTALRERIKHSDGGTFLVAGFPGVGKSTVVNRALQQLTVPNDKGRVLVPVYVNVARPINPEQLLFAVIRRTVDTLTDQGLCDRMPTSALRQLLLAYARTSMSLTQHDERSHQYSRDLSIGGASGSAGAQFILNSLLPKLELGSTDSRSLAIEASFLGYSDTDVEHDFLRVATLLSTNPPAAPTGRSWFRRRRPDAPPAPRPTGLVVVFDELDKLTAAAGGAEALEGILGSLKNILNCDGVHVILVGGPDLHDRVLLDVEDGDGLYAGVIGWQLYVPCLWDCADRLLEKILKAPAAETPPSATDRAAVLEVVLLGTPELKPPAPEKDA